jgi:hypothetical protein
MLTFTCTHAHTYTHAHTQTHTHAHMHTCTHIHTCVHTHSLKHTGPPLPSPLWLALKEASEEAAWEMAAGRLVALELVLPPAPQPEVCMCA